MGQWSRVPTLLVGIAAGFVMFLSVRSGHWELAVASLALAMLFANWYSSWLRERGVVLEDERTIRINEIASRRTLQIAVIALGFSVLVLSQWTSAPEIKGAFKALSVFLVGISMLHLLLRHYYSRVM
ncbi:DUF2178 domain-containing protein [Thermococcus sp. AM4]|uniref:DUF2178 domain-containing protein n=1 Tax=Thermococcus sp. (strain AM4) TaxID=246969 RepID=UPI0002299421|nr:DUF2178 domain-containing protein [Thermococcus sp. AM4]AEO13952.1 hypothetical protein TAM4_2354 [Thermococcus sp. AM4]